MSYRNKIQELLSAGKTKQAFQIAMKIDQAKYADLNEAYLKNERQNMLLLISNDDYTTAKNNIVRNFLELLGGKTLQRDVKYVLNEKDVDFLVSLLDNIDVKLVALNYFEELKTFD